jgi:hypothetical protein
VAMGRSRAGQRKKWPLLIHGSGRSRKSRDTQSRHHGGPVSGSAAFRAPPPDLCSAPLMDMALTAICQPARRSRPISSFCPWPRAFAPRFFHTQPRSCSPCPSLSFTSIRLVGVFHPSNCRTSSAHKKVGACDGAHFG